jgi:hypothetical protein
MTKIPDHIRPENYPDENAYGDALADWIESDGFEPGELRDATPLWRVRAAREAAERAEQFLTEEVRAVHELGFSWTAIARMLGVTRQAARQRFAEPARH